MRNLDTPVKQIRRKIFTEIAKIGFESTDESMIHDIESIPYNIVEERAKYRESICKRTCPSCHGPFPPPGKSFRPPYRWRESQQHRREILRTTSYAGDPFRMFRM